MPAIPLIDLREAEWTPEERREHENARWHVSAQAAHRNVLDLLAAEEAARQVEEAARQAEAMRQDIEARIAAWKAGNPISPETSPFYSPPKRGEKIEVGDRP